MLLLAILLLFIYRAQALNCEKSFTYYEEYGQNSFNVSCSGITKGYEHILENITINNEISLTVADSTIENATANLFRNVHNIKILHIFNSTFEFDRKLKIFEKLVKLESLLVEDTHFQVESVTLEGLNSLKRLELRNNGLSTVGKGGFASLTNLERLEIVNNHVQVVEELQLCELKKLKHLILRSNLIRNLRSFSFSCLQRSSKQPHFSNQTGLESTFYKLSTLSYDLVELDLSLNQILDLGYSLDNLDRLRQLNLGYNKLVGVKSSGFKSLSRLQKLNLTHNELRIFDSKLFLDKAQLSSVDLSYNYLTTFTASDVPQLQLLDLGYNKITSISLRNITNLQKLNLRCNEISSLNFDNFQKVTSLKALNLAGNKLNLTSGGLFQNLEGLRYLSLSNNSLKNVPDQVFLGLTYLRYLDLSSNQIETLDINTFHDLANLEVLNLSDNSIKSLSYQTIQPLKNLRSLDLGSNQLMFIEYDKILSNLPSLSNINIKSNQFTCGDLGKIISYLKLKSIVYTRSEHLENLSQNVAGIPCSTAVKHMLVSARPERGALFNFGMFMVAVLGSVITGIVSYRFYIYLKRRRYRADEFELVLE